MEQGQIDIRAFQAFLNALQDPACYVNTDGSVLYRNTKAEAGQLFALEQPMVQSIPHSKTDVYVSAFEQTFRSGVETRFTYQKMASENGEFVEVSIVPMLIGRMLVGLVTARTTTPQTTTQSGKPIQLDSQVAPTIGLTPDDEAPKKKQAKELREKELEAMRQLEARLTETERNFVQMKQSIEQCPDSIMSVSKDLKVTFVNREIDGRASDSLIGFDAPPVLSPEDAPAAKKSLDESFKTGRPTSFRSRHKGTKDSQAISWRLNRVIPTTNTTTATAGDRPTELLIFSTDISEVVASEDEFARASRVFRAIMDYAPIMLTTKDTNGKYLQINSFTSKLLGKKKQDVAGKMDRDILPAHVADSIRRNDKEVVTSRRTQTFDESITTNGGETLQFISTKIPITSDDDEVHAICTISVDVTAQKSAEETSRLFRALTESSRDLFCYMDIDGKPLYVNKASAESFGFNNSASSFGEFVTPTIAQKVFKEVIPAILKSGKSWEGDVEFVNKNTGEVVPGWQRMTVVNDEAGKPKFIAATGADVTSRIAAEHALAEAAKMASLGSMAGGIAHEINNPLAIIYGKSCQIRKLATRGDISPTELAMELEKIEQTAVRISRIIKGLRSFARNGEKDPMTDVPLTSVIDETLSFCKERFRNHNVELNSTVTTGAVVKCRSIQLTQVLLNLLNNAFDAVQDLPEKWIDLQIDEEQDKVSIALVDSGRGISAAVVERMMEPFFTTSDVSRGPGLGLSIAKGIAEQHGGRLFYSPLDGHTRFIMELPKVTGISTSSSSKKDAA